MADLTAKIDCGCQTVGMRLAELTSRKIVLLAEIQKMERELYEVHFEIMNLEEPDRKVGG